MKIKYFSLGFSCFFLMNIYDLEAKEKKGSPLRNTLKSSKKMKNYRRPQRHVFKSEDEAKEYGKKFNHRPKQTKHSSKEEKQKKLIKEDNKLYEKLQKDKDKMRNNRRSDSLKPNFYVRGDVFQNIVKDINLKPEDRTMFNDFAQDIDKYSKLLEERNRYQRSVFGKLLKDYEKVKDAGSSNRRNRYDDDEEEESPKKKESMRKKLAHKLKNYKEYAVVAKKIDLDFKNMKDSFGKKIEEMRKKINDTTTKDEEENNRYSRYSSNDKYDFLKNKVLNNSFLSYLFSSMYESKSRGNSYDNYDKKEKKIKYYLYTKDQMVSLEKEFSEFSTFLEKKKITENFIKNFFEILQKIVSNDSFSNSRYEKEEIKKILEDFNKEIKKYSESDSKNSNKKNPKEKIRILKEKLELILKNIETHFNTLELDKDMKENISKYIKDSINNYCDQYKNIDNYNTTSLDFEGIGKKVKNLFQEYCDKKIDGDKTKQNNGLKKKFLDILNDKKDAYDSKKFEQYFAIRKNFVDNFIQKILQQKKYNDE